jgi:hypothetical protein
MIVGIILTVWLLISLGFLLSLARAARREPMESATEFDDQTSESLSADQSVCETTTHAAKLNPINSLKAT